MSETEEDFKLSQLDKRALGFLLKYLRHHIGFLVLATIAMLTVTLTILAGPYLTKIAIDNYILKGNLAGLNWILALMLISYGLFWFSSYWQTYLSSLIGQKVVGHIRTDLYQHLQELPIDFYRKRKTGDIMSRITHDVNALSDIVSTGFIHLLNDFFTLVGIVLIMMFLNFRLALISFLTIPLIFLAIFFLGKRMRKAYKGVREKLAELNADVEESISGIRIVQALNREAINTGKFKRLSWENLKANLKAVSYFALLFPTMTLSRVFGESLVLLYGGWQVVNDVISLGVIIAFLSYVRIFFGPLADLSQVYNTYQSAGASLDRIYEYMSIQPSIKEQGKSIRADNEFKGEINFEEVSFGYDEQQTVIERFNLHINPGEVFALVGATGAGKTTIVNLLTRLYDVVHGRIVVDGIDLRQIPFDELRKLIAVVPQNVFLFDTSVKENIRYGAPEAKHEEVEMAAKRVYAHDFITNLPDGYETEVGEGGVRLSGGQRQLISFARALIADPKILILDEAISSVDAYTEVLIQKALEELLKDRTAIIIAHRFSTLRRADRIGVLQDGSLIGVGRHEELMQSNSIYRELFQKQTGAEA